MGTIGASPRHCEPSFGPRWRQSAENMTPSGVQYSTDTASNVGALNNVTSCIGMARKGLNLRKREGSWSRREKSRRGTASRRHTERDRRHPLIPSITSRCDDASRAVLHLDHAARPLHPGTPRLVEDPRDVVNQMTRPSGFPPISVQMMENDAVVGQDDQRLRCSRIEQADEFLRDQDRPQKRDGYFAFRRCLGV